MVLAIYIILLFACFNKGEHKEFQSEILSSLILCDFLLSPLNPLKEEQSYYIDSFPNKLISDPNIFSRKYVHIQEEFENLLRKESVDLNNRVSCLEDNKLIKKNKSENCNLSLAIIEVSDFYFFHYNKGFFVAGVNRQYANVYTFEIEKGKITIKWASPFYIS